MKINYENYTVVFSADDEGKIWLDPYNHIFILEETLIKELLEKNIIRPTTEGATQTDLAGEQCYNGRVSGKDRCTG
jgi:hypothetical protein